MGDIALICIDLQKEYFTKGRPLRISSRKRVLKKVKMMLQYARARKIPVIHIKHVSKKPLDETFRKDSRFTEFMDEVKPLNEENIVVKSSPGAFYRTNLDQILNKLGIKKVVICGLTSFLCCDTTSREAQARGYKVFFVKDATAALEINGVSGKKIHEVVCAIQQWYFAEVILTKDFLKI